MKRILSGLLLAVFIALGVSTNVSAAPAQTDVTGVITHNHVEVAGASVSVLCQGHTETDTTDAHGSYLVTFLAGACPFGSTVKVTASKNDLSGVASGTVQGITTKLNLAIVNVSIPEYGLLGGLTAVGAGAGLILYNRRRHQAQLTA